MGGKEGDAVRISDGTYASAEGDMNSGRVVVFGYGELGSAAVTALGSAGAQIVAVVVPSNRSGDDVVFMTNFARNQGLPVLVQPARKAIGPFVQELRALEPDLMVVWSYPMILPREVIAVPRRGTINVHGGLLPEYRGGHVMQWAIINGEAETGVALHYMDEGIDTGPIIAQGRFPIQQDDDAATVRQKLKTTGIALLQEWWPAIAEGRAPKIQQDETKAKYHRLRTQDDGVIDWSAASTAVCRLVKALVRPWPGAFTFVNGRKLVIWRSRPLQVSAGGQPGLVTQVDEQGAIVLTGDGQVLIEDSEVDGQRNVGMQLQKILRVGDRLGA